jgi:diguanylate cyclase (GGDEF)-like protein/PAS domain S-box-containing protein
MPGLADLPNYHLPFALLSFAATGLGSLALLREKRVTAERDLFRAALLQSPDFHYIKDRRGRFVAVNASVAAHHGFADPYAMRGLTDHDLEPPERANELIAAERAIVDTGIALLDHEERLVDASGVEHWYLTSKVPLIGHQGDIVGLAGVTRDITQRKAMEREVIEGRNLLSFALTEMSDGLAMFDASGTLLLANERYRRMFPLTSELRLPGVHLGTILRAAAERGEQLGIDANAREDWIAATIAGLRQPVEQDVQLLDGRWLLVRNRPTAIGTTMVVVSDITTLKQSEAALKKMTEQLKLLASTDGLTGLLNRRSFDLAIERELAAAARSAAPLSLLMIDVDHFKDFNDHYGHPAGDSCLRQAAHALRNAAVRPTDICARYGGEEFAVILPDTDGAGAFLVAERIRTAIEHLQIPHAASPQGIATVSIGLATTSPTEELAQDELIAAADAALYAAKAAGRNRIVVAPDASEPPLGREWLQSPTGT